MVTHYQLIVTEGLPKDFLYVLADIWRLVIVWYDDGEPRHGCIRLSLSFGCE